MLNMHRGPIVRTPPWGKWLLSQLEQMKQNERDLAEKIMQLDNNYYQVHPDFGFRR